MCARSFRRREADWKNGVGLTERRNVEIMEKICNVMERLICILTFFLFSMILLINIAADFTEYTWKRSFLIPNGILIAIAGIVWYLFSDKRGREHHALVWPIVPCTIL